MHCSAEVWILVSVLLAYILCVGFLVGGFVIVSTVRTPQDGMSLLHAMSLKKKKNYHGMSFQQVMF